MKWTNLFFVAIFFTIKLNAQSPDKFNYQAVIRDADGNIKANTSVNIQIGILQGSIGGTSVYVETYSKITTSQGLVNLVIGSGTVVSGSLAGIDWATGPYYIKLWVNGSELGTTQLLSVPYAKYADKAGNGFSGNYADLINKPKGKKLGDIQYWNDTTWVLLSAGLNGQVLTLINGVPGWVGEGGYASFGITSVSNISTSSATIQGNITNDGGSTIFNKGVCYSQSPNPTLSDKFVSAGAWPGYFSVVITGLNSNTTFYARPYSTNIIGTSYGNQISFITLSQNTSKTISDIDGNLYDTVHIGTQIWLGENLSVTKFNDGTPITLSVDTSSWTYPNSPLYCWSVGDSIIDKNLYGALYNWPAINTGKLCPTGWHVATDNEWTILTTYLGGENVAGGKLKEVGTNHWYFSNTGATNLADFSWIPAGLRIYGSINGVSLSGNIWTSTELDTGTAWYRSAVNTSIGVTRNIIDKMDGLSVRCIKN
jgi:uncharacterized protein (TIGR02145 family)